MKNKKGTIVIVFIVLAVLVFGVTYLAIYLTRNVGKNTAQVSEESAVASMERMYKRINIHTLDPVKGNVDLTATDEVVNLPDISKYPVQVDNVTADYVEIFSSTEKATDNGTDRWLLDMAEAFNASGATVNNQPVSVRIRGIASGVARDYISSGTYVPEAFSPSNELWGDALAASGVKLKLVEKCLTGNVAGIVLSKDKNREIINKYGSVSLKSIISAVANGEINMGYTNPFASSTGANFLMSTLYSFNNSDPFAEDAVQAFEDFQTNIPFVAYTTLQMKEAVKSGALDGFVYEYQQFVNTPDFNTYEFTPFGMRHDSPVYELGDLSAEKEEILQQFIAFCKSAESQKKASDYGFNGHSEYTNEIAALNGSELTKGQKLWKEKKNGNKDIIAVFVADISGSMEGAPLNALKESLLQGAKYIGSGTSVGLVTFSDDVNIAVPIGKFDLTQRSLFVGAVESMDAGGATAMFDAIVVAQKMLYDAKADNPNAKLMLFVLSDGETNAGFDLNDTRKMIEGLRVPITTIGYNADIRALSVVSGINEAASINADTDDVVYQLQNLFNAEM